MSKTISVSKSAPFDVEDTKWALHAGVPLAPGVVHPPPGRLSAAQLHRGQLLEIAAELLDVAGKETWGNGGKERVTPQGVARRVGEPWYLWRGGFSPLTSFLLVPQSTPVPAALQEGRWGAKKQNGGSACSHSCCGGGEPCFCTLHALDAF